MKSRRQGESSFLGANLVEEMETKSQETLQTRDREPFYFELHER